MRIRGLLPLLRITPAVLLCYCVTSVIAVLGSFGSERVNPVAVLSLALIVTTLAALSAKTVELVAIEWRVSEPYAFFIAIVIAGLLRGVALLEGLNVLGLSGEVSSWTRILNSVTSILVWMTIIGLLDASREQYRRRYAALMRQAAAAASDIDPGLDDHPDMIRLKSTLAGFASPSQLDLSTPALAAAAIRMEIEKSLRPLSHRIWFGTGVSEPRARVSRLLGDALLRMPVPVGAVTIAWLVTGFVGAVSLFGAARGALSIVISTCVLLSCLLLTRAVMRSAHVVLGPALFVACSVLPIVLTDLIVARLGYSSTLGSPQSIFVILALGGLILCATAISLAAADRAVILDLVGSRVIELEAESREGLRGEPTELSAFIHNSLQAELHGLALQLDEASRLHDEGQARAALERLSALAGRSLSEDFLSFREAPLDRLSRVTEAWAGIADVHLYVDEGLDPLDPRLPTAIRAVEELVANSVRHGRASSVNVRLLLNDHGNVLIDLDSDGVMSERTPGMGEGWLSSVSQSPVRLTHSEKGTAVLLEI